jgi:zinc protease
MRPGLALALALVAALLAGAPSRADFRDPAADTRITKLENGLTVLTLEDHATPVVSIQIWVRVGSGDEARFTGLAHLFEHMMFRGSKNLGPEEHQKLIEQRGGQLNAYTSRDVTVYFTDISREHLSAVLALEAERLQNLAIDEESLASERDVVISERRFRTEDDPEGRLFESLLALTFLAHPYRIPTVGWMSDLEKMGVAECRAFFDEYYAPNNLVMSLAGDFDTEEALALVRRLFGSMEPAAHVERNPTEEPPQLGERRGVVRFQVQSPVVAMAWHAPATGHADSEALDVASQILSAGRTSRLYRKLVYDEPIALSASGGYWELQRAGLFFAYTQVRPGVSADVAEQTLAAEIEGLRAALVTPEELAKAKRAMEMTLVAGQGSANALASRIAQEYVSLGRIRLLDERLAKYEAVTAEDVQRVARRYLVPEGRTVVQLLPSNGAAGGAR